MIRRTFSALTLIAALGAPAVMPAVALAEAQPGVSIRIYDRSHHDYHRWNHDEDRRYRQYLAEHHRSYRSFTRTSRQQQLAYWQWRHDHGGR
jgi:dienelactone hydrolase